MAEQAPYGPGGYTGQLSDSPDSEALLPERCDVFPDGLCVGVRIGSPTGDGRDPSFLAVAVGHPAAGAPAPVGDVGGPGAVHVTGTRVPAVPPDGVPPPLGRRGGRHECTSWSVHLFLTLHPFVSGTSPAYKLSTVQVLRVRAWGPRRRLLPWLS